MGLQIITGRRTGKTLEMIRSIKFMAKNGQETQVIVGNKERQKAVRELLIDNLTARQMEYVKVLTPEEAGIKGRIPSFDELDSVKWLSGESFLG